MWWEVDVNKVKKRRRGRARDSGGRVCIRTTGQRDYFKVHMEAHEAKGSEQRGGAVGHNGLEKEAVAPWSRMWEKMGSQEGAFNIGDSQICVQQGHTTNCCLGSEPWGVEWTKALWGRGKMQGKLLEAGALSRDRWPWPGLKRE